MLHDTPYESLHAEFEDLKKSKKKADLNNLKKTLQAADNFDALPENIKKAINKNLVAFLRDHHAIAENIKIEILVARAIDLGAIDAAVLLISEKHYLKKLKANFEAAKKAAAATTPEFQKLMTKFEFNLQWLIALKKYSDSTKYLAGHEKAPIVLQAIKFLNKKSKQISNYFYALFDDQMVDDQRQLQPINNPYKNANLAYFIANPSTCAKFLTQQQVTQMFSLATVEQVLPLCSALAKHRPELLSQHLQVGERVDYKIRNVLTTQNSARATEFITYKPRALTQELFLDALNAIDLDTFKSYLLNSHDPRKILKAHGDLVLKNSVREFGNVKTKNLSELKDLLNENDVTQLATNLHFIVKRNKHLSKVIDDSNRTALMNTLTANTDRKEWVIMHLKENPVLVKNLCAPPHSGNFLKLLKLTDNPGEFVRKLAGQIDSRDRAKIIFQSVIEVARYTAAHPEYQAEFDKLLNERFVCDVDEQSLFSFGYRTVRDIASHFLSRELYQFREQAPKKSTRFYMNAKWLGGRFGSVGTKDGDPNYEADLSFLLQDKNTKNLFNLTKQQLQQIAAQHVTQQSTHKALAEHHYKTMNLANESSTFSKKIHDKSVYYALQNIPAAKRSKALNEAIFGVAVKDQSDATKQLISLAVQNLFNDPLTLLGDLDKADFDAFIKYFKEQIALADAKDLIEINNRFYGVVRGQNFDAIIEQRVNSQDKPAIQPQILEIPGSENVNPVDQVKGPSEEVVRLKSVAKHSIELSANIFYEYATKSQDPEHTQYLNHLFLGLNTEAEMNRKIFYGAIVRGDWKYIEANKAKFIEALQITDTSKTHFSTFDAVLTKDIVKELVKGLDLQELYRLRQYKEIKLAMVDKFQTDKMHVKEQMIFIEMLKDREFEDKAIPKLAKIILDASCVPGFLTWYQDKGVQYRLTPYLSNIIFFNQANQDFTKALLSTLSDSKRTTILRDARLDETFITAYPEVLHFRKVAAAKDYKDIVKEDRSLLKILSTVFKLPVVPQATIDFFKLDNYELFFQIFNKKVVNEVFNNVDLKILHQVIFAFLSENEFVQALTRPENRATAIAILNSGDEKLIEKFWDKAKDQTLLVEQVLESIIDEQAQIEKAKDAIVAYYNNHASREIAKRYADHSNIVPFSTSNLLEVSIMNSQILDVKDQMPSQVSTEEKKDKDEKKSEKEGSKVQVAVESEGNSIPSVPQQEATKQEIKEVSNLPKVKRVKMSFRNVEDIYKFIFEHRNDLPLRTKTLAKLQKQKPELLAQAYQSSKTIDYGIRLLLNEAEDYVPVEVKKSRRTHAVLSPQIKKAKIQERFSQESAYKESLAFKMEQREKTKQEIKKLGEKPRSPSDVIKVLKNLTDEAKKIKKDKLKSASLDKLKTLKRNKSVWQAYEIVRSQYAILQAIQNNEIELKEDKKDQTTKKARIQLIIEESGLNDKTPLDAVLNQILSQANLYLEKNNQKILAAFYYYDIIKAAQEIKGISQEIVFEASLKLINQMIKNPSLFEMEDHELQTQINSDTVMRSVFNAFFDTSIYSDKFINEKFASFPLEWLENPVIVECIEAKLDTHEAVATFIETAVPVDKPEYDVANDNLEQLKKTLALKTLIIQRAEVDDNEHAQRELLKQIFKRDPQLLFNEELTFSLDVVLTTVASDLNILLFYLRNPQLSESWLADESSRKKLVEVAKQDELVKFVLTGCYTHLSKRFVKEDFSVSTTSQDNSQTQTVQDQENVDDSIPPPPPLDRNIPPPPEPPSGGIVTTTTKEKTWGTTKKEKKDIQPSAKTPESKSVGPISLQDIASQREKMKERKENKQNSNSTSDQAVAPLQQEVPNQSKIDVGNLAFVIKQNKDRANQRAWQAIFFDEKQGISGCGNEIMKNLQNPVTKETDIVPDIKTGFSEVYIQIEKMKQEELEKCSEENNVVVPKVVALLKENRNLGDAKAFEHNKDLSALAKAMVTVALAKKRAAPKPVEKPKPAPKVVEVKLIPITAREQIEGILVDKGPDGLYTLGSFLGNVNKLVEMTDALIAIYEKYILAKEAKQELGALNIELEKLLENHMTNVEKERVADAHKRGTSAPLAEVLRSRVNIILGKFGRLHETYQKSRNPDKRPSIVDAISNKKEFLEKQQKQQTAGRTEIYQLKYQDEKKNEAFVFPKEAIKQVLAREEVELLEKFETALWTAIEKLHKGRTVSIEILRAALYGISNRNGDLFNADFDKHILTPLKEYAKQNKKEHLLIAKLEIDKVIAAPTIEDLYQRKVFDKAALTDITGEEVLKQVEAILADTINYLQMHKPIFREELLARIGPFLTTSTAEQAFNDVIWQAILAYAKENDKSRLVQEKDPLKEKRNNGPKLFDKSKQVGEASTTVVKQEHDKKGPPSTSTQVI